MGPVKHPPFKTEVPPKHVACSSRAKRAPQHIVNAPPRQIASGSRNKSVVGFLRIGAVSVVLAFLAANAVGATNHTGPTVLPTEPRYWSVSVSWENDTFAGTDQFYTDGVSLSVAHTGPSWLDPVADWLPWGKGRRTVGYNMAQGMYTQADTTLTIPDPNDRPYAGILSLGLTLHVDRSNSYHGLKFITGVVGPWSLAEETQRQVHYYVGSGKPQGWGYQLKNEPILNLAYEYRHKFRLAGRLDGWAVQAMPTAAAWLGNVLTEGQIGAQLRFGYNMPDDFGIALARDMGHLPPPRRDEGTAFSSSWGFSIYGGAVANLVLWDITLDGNTFQDSPSVNKEFFVPVAAVGMAVGNRRFLASFTYVFWGKEFEGQPEYSQFGAITFSYFF